MSPSNNARKHDAMGWKITLGISLRQARIKRGFTQSELATLIGRSQPHVCHVENARYELTVADYLAWCDACRVSPTRLLAAARRAEP